MNKNVPVVRFKEFTDNWEQRKFGEVFMPLQNNTLSRAELNDEFGTAQNIHYGDVLIKYDEVLDVSKESLSYIEKQSIADKFKTSYLQNGDVIIADTAEDETVGKCTEIEGLTDQKVISGLHTMPVRPNRKFAAGFLGFYLNSAAYHDQLKPLMQGIKVTSISKGVMQDTVVKFPLDLKEQEQIGMYFSGLDHLITLHQQKLEKLINVRANMFERLFPRGTDKVPGIRFKKFKSDWEERTLGSIVTPYTDYLPTPDNGYMRLGLRSFMKGTFYEYVEAKKRLGEKRLQRVKKDNLIVNIVFAWEHAIAVTTEEDEGKLVSHRFPQFSFNEGMYPRFFHYALGDERFRHHLWLASPSGAGRNKTLRINEMLEYKLLVPKHEEQKRIADYLDSIDQLVELYGQRIEKLKNIKAACLDGMFI